MMGGLRETASMVKMLTVYSLREELANNPQRLELIHKVSLDRSKTWAGLSPRLGLFGTEEWWRNVEIGLIPRVRYDGLITETFCAGMDSDRRHNSFRMKTDDGREYSWNMIPKYKPLFRPGHRAEIVTIVHELKRRSADGKPELMDQPLEMRLSTKPASDGS